MKKYFNRTLLNELKSLIHRPEVFAIKGPRQSGKTTLLKILQNWLIGNLSQPSG